VKKEDWNNRRKSLHDECRIENEVKYDELSRLKFALSSFICPVNLRTIPNLPDSICQMGVP
jgi:hypothetical protein